MNKPRKISALVFVILLAVTGIFYFRRAAAPRPIPLIPAAGDKSLNDYYQEAQQLAAQNNNATTTATFLAVGDIMLSRDVALNIQQAGDVNWPFEKISDKLKSTDFNFTNLEGPAAPSEADNRVGGNSMIFGDPAANLAALKDFNFRIVNLANNHAWDQGLAGIDSTIANLDRLGIAHEGAGDNLDRAWTPAVVAAEGIKICFIGASYGTNSGGSQAAQYVAEMSDAVHLQSAIRNAKSLCDFIIVTMHAGTEYRRAPNSQQVAFAHEAIDDGADMVIGAHPHWVQPIEKYCSGSSSAVGEGFKPSPTNGQTNCKYIFYSLGNFVFDQNFSQDTMEGLTLKITISKVGTGLDPSLHAASGDDLQGTRQPATLQSIELLPVIIDNSQPRLATAEEAKNILGKIGESENILH